MTVVPPRFSVVTPTYDRPALLRRAIKSVLAQSFENFEYIIVDDGENPDTAKEVAAFGDPRIVYRKHPVNKGTAAACNTGIRCARGELVAFLGDDDEYLPGYLEKMSDLFHRHGSQLHYAWSGIVRVRDTEDGEVVWRRAVWPETFTDTEAGLEVATAIGSSFGLCIRRECFPSVGYFDEGFTVSEDTEYVLRLAQSLSFRTLPEVLVKIHAHEGQQQVDKRFTLDNWRDYHDTIRRHWKFIVRHPRVMHAHGKAYAMICYAVGKPNAGRWMYWNLIIRSPFRRILYADLYCLERFGKHYLLWKREGGR